MAIRRRCDCCPQVLAEGDTVLVDAGCSYNGYASDITRVWPVGGAFSEPQRRLYDEVLRCQRACLEALREPGVDRRTLQRLACRLLSDSLVRLGVFPGIEPEEVLKQKLFKPYYPHGVSHYLGLDVHDTQSPWGGGEGGWVAGWLLAGGRRWPEVGERFT